MSLAVENLFWWVPVFFISSCPLVSSDFGILVRGGKLKVLLLHHFGPELFLFYRVHSSYYFLWLDRNLWKICLWPLSSTFSQAKFICLLHAFWGTIYISIVASVSLYLNMNSSAQLLSNIVWLNPPTLPTLFMTSPSTCQAMVWVLGSLFTFLSVV